LSCWKPRKRFSVQKVVPVDKTSGGFILAQVDQDKINNIVKNLEGK
jgi:hypothetical protein